jgi:hypothetical protein
MQKKGGVFPSGDIQSIRSLIGIALFVGSAFVVALYLVIVTEVRNFPHKAWQAFYAVFSIPMFLLFFLWVVKFDVHDYFLILFFTEVIGKIGRQGRIGILFHSLDRFFHPLLKVGQGLTHIDEVGFR